MVKLIYTMGSGQKCTSYSVLTSLMSSHPILGFCKGKESRIGIFMFISG